FEMCGVRSATFSNRPLFVIASPPNPASGPAFLLLAPAPELLGEQVAERRALALRLLRGLLRERLPHLLVVDRLDRQRDLLFVRVDAGDDRADAVALLHDVRGLRHRLRREL